ncbi:MAG: hypothetical protein ACE15E_07215 [Acidobacteriota bacterium]
MPTQPVIPAVDPIPLPGPVWLFWTLLVLTFLLHTIAMNCVFGGTLISTTAFLRRSHPFHQRLAGDLARKIPSFLAATITLGVAPLLFVQVLYGQFFYSSSVILAWPWLSVIVLLTIGYYASYLVAFKGERSGYRFLSFLALAVFLTIAFIYTNNFTLLLTPEKWLARYHADSAGLNLNLEEPMLWPRLVHTLVAAAAVAGLLVVVLGLMKRKQDPAYAQFLLQHGAYWFIVPTMLQFIVGTWFLISLPRDKLMFFLGGDWRATLLFGATLVATLPAVLLMLAALRSNAPRRLALTSLLLTAFVLIGMALMREVLRRAYLAPFLETPDARIQWNLMVLFLVLFAGSLVLWGAMLRKYFRTGETPPEAGPFPG